MAETPDPAADVAAETGEDAGQDAGQDGGAEPSAPAEGAAPEEAPADTQELVVDAAGAIARIDAADDRVVVALEVLDDLELTGEWDAVLRVVEHVTASPGRSLRAAERAELAFRGGAAAEAAEDETRARAMFEEALAADPGHQAALLSLGNLLFRYGEHEQADKTLTTLLARYRDELDPASRAEAYYRLARIRMETDQAEKARSTVEKALASLPEHRAARRLLIELHTADGNWDKVVQHERRLLDHEESAEARRDGLLRLGDLVVEKLGDLHQAEDRYREAAALFPRDETPWRRMEQMFLKAEDATGAARSLAYIAAIPDRSPRERAISYLEMARLYRDRLEDAETAVACYNQALDFDKALLDGFEECTELLVSGENWLAVEQHYRRMLGRLGRDGAQELRAALWRNLVEIYRTRLNDPERALLAAEAVCDLAPNDRAGFEVTAALMASSPQVDAARIRRFHRQYLQLDPARLDSIRSLRSVELRSDRPDVAWLLCARLAADGVINHDEEAFLENLRRPSLPVPTAPLNSELWARYLRHPAVDSHVEVLLALAGTALYGLYTEDLKAFGVKKRHRIAPDAPLLFARVLADLSEAMGLSAPPDAYQSRSEKGARLVGATPPAVVVGKDMLSGRSHRELAFHVGRQLALLRPGFLLTVYVPEQTLPWLVRCIVGHFVDAVTVPSDAAADAVRKALRDDLDAPVRGRLEEVARQLGHDLVDGHVDHASFQRGIERTCDRVGLLLCEDLSVAAASVSADRRDDLLAWAISEDHAALRSALGIAYTIE